MFGFLTKEGRARIAERKEQRAKEKAEARVRKARCDFEAHQNMLSPYERACRWFEDWTSTYEWCGLGERAELDVKYLKMMMSAIDSGDELRQGYLHELVKDPLPEFHRRYFNFVNMYLAELKRDGTEGQGFRMSYGGVKQEDVELIIGWAIEHGDDCARMFLYELRVWQGRLEEAAEIRRESQYYKQTPWYWKRVDADKKLDEIRSNGDNISFRWSLVKNGQDFESFILWRLKKANVVCDRIGGAGDQGVDIIVHGGDHKVAIQCKFYSHPVDNAAVQQVYAGMAFHGCTKALVVTNSSYSPGAKELAKKLGVKLCDYLHILDELREYGCNDVDLDEWTAMGTHRGIRETLLRHPGVLV